jgi:hypothetical protein
LDGDDLSIGVFCLSNDRDGLSSLKASAVSGLWARLLACVSMQGAWEHGPSLVNYPTCGSLDRSSRTGAARTLQASQRGVRTAIPRDRAAADSTA